MSIKIRLKRFGTKKRPYYRVVVTDSRDPRDSRPLEEVGYYHPLDSDDKAVNLKADRIKEWIGKGALPSTTVKKLINKHMN